MGSLIPFPDHHPGGPAASRRLVASAGLRDRRRVLVFACGAGATAIRIARDHDCEVVGSDINPHAIERARRAAAAAKLRGRLSFVVDDLFASSLPAESFDCIVVESVLVGLPKREALAALCKLLAPGGLFAINELTHSGRPGLRVDDIEEHFRSMGIPWSLPAHGEW